MNEHNTDLKLTRRKLLEELITSSMEKVMDKYADKISEKISEKQKLRSDHKTLNSRLKVMQDCGRMLCSARQVVHIF